MQLVNVVAGHAVWSSGDEASGRRCMTDMHGDGGDFLRESGPVPITAELPERMSRSDVVLQKLYEEVLEAIGEDSDFFQQNHRDQIASIRELLERGRSPISNEMAEKILSRVASQFTEKASSRN